MINNSKMLLQNLQDTYSAYINMTLYMTDLKGNPMTNISGISPFVELLVYQAKQPFLYQLKNIIDKYCSITNCVVIDAFGCPFYGVKALLVPIIIEQKIIGFIWCWSYLGSEISDNVKAAIDLDDTKLEWKEPIFQLPELTNEQVLQIKEQVTNMAYICAELLKSKTGLEHLNEEVQLLNALKATNIRYHQLLEIIKKNENLDYVGFASIDGDFVKIKAFNGPSEDSLIGSSFIKAGTFIEDISSCRGLKHLDNIGFDPRLSFLMKNGIRTGCFFCFPILIDNQVEACIFGGKIRENRLGTNTIQRVSNIISIVELGMNNEWLKSRIDLHLMKLSILMEISKSMVSLKNLQDLLLLITNIASSLVPSNFTSITTKYGNFEFLNVTNKIDEMTIIEYCQSFYERTFTTEKTNAAFRKGPRIIEKYGTVIMECPIYIEESLFGMISVSLIESSGFKEAEAYLNSLSAISGLALKPLLKKLQVTESHSLIELLTARELDVLKLIVKGRSNKEIGDELYISTHTVKNHISNILNKLGVNDRTQIIATFYELNYKD